MKILKHILIIAAVIMIVLGIPFFTLVDVKAFFSPERTDVVSEATVEIPEQPSGVFYLIINKNNHKTTIDKWETFFSGKDAGVIMDDIEFMTADFDEKGNEFANIYMLRLAENQMKIKRENILLLMSKAQSGSFDAVLLSKEIADSYRLDTVLNNDVLLITIVDE